MFPNTNMIMENSYNGNKQAEIVDEPHGNFQNYRQPELTVMKNFSLENPPRKFFYKNHEGVMFSNQITPNYDTYEQWKTPIIKGHLLSNVNRSIPEVKRSPGRPRKNTVSNHDKSSITKIKCKKNDVFLNQELSDLFVKDNQSTHEASTTRNNTNQSRLNEIQYQSLQSVSFNEGVKIPSRDKWVHRLPSHTANEMAPPNYQTTNCYIPANFTNDEFNALVNIFPKDYIYDPSDLNVFLALEQLRI